jgi:transcription initiation factor TFIID TATA-box-binding protein
MSIQNIISTANLGSRIDLKFIANNGTNIEYKPNKFVAAILRLRKPKTTALVFNSGKIVCTGTKNIEENRKGARRVARIIQKIYKFKKRILFANYIVQNMVASFSVPFKIDLLAFHQAYPKKCFYDEIIFPGLKYCPYSDRSTVLIFISGKIVITGVKCVEKINDIECLMRRIVLRFKRPFPYVTPFLMNQ